MGKNNEALDLCPDSFLVSWS